MNPPEKEEDTKKTSVRPERPEPLCLFCFPESSVGDKTYVNTFSKEADNRRTTAREQKKEKEDFWLRKRTEARIRRRRMKEPIRNLKSFLMSSVKNEKVELPSVFQVLEIVKDAWPSPSSRNLNFKSDEVKQKPQNMKNEQLLNRRLSMPEELMRKYSVSKERTSEESETNKTAIDISPSSSSTLETARRKETERAETKEKEPKTESTQTEACDTNLPKRVTQSDFYKQGKQIIKVKEHCTCRKEEESSSTASAKEETDESATSESLPSSSPTQLPKRESSSGNLSSESDNIQCTCAELSSKETSTDLYFSGKSTLSQTVSDKSMSTQDSTVSINSVSTRGSTVSDNSNSTTPEVERTSAKETTTSPDYSPRTPRNRKNRRRDKELCHSKTCPRYEPKHSVNYKCPLHFDTKTTANAATNTENTKEVAETQTKQPTDNYKWAKLSQEELYMMQQLRHRKFVESQRKVSDPPDSITACGTGSSYQQTEHLEQPIMIPRYSALPRTLSMLVNTSSPDTSHNSDSDNQSLADSLEDQPITHVHKLYFDTKKESKPVRGDASVVQDTKFKHRQPRGRAFFVSIKEPYGEDVMLENIEKIPQPPEKIKNQIFERHLNLCTKHKHVHPPAEPKTKVDTKKKKTKNVNEQKTTKKQEKQKPKEEKGKTSKIPVLVSSRSTSSSPERETERLKIRTKREKPETEVETTQILEITHGDSLQKPQAVIHPSQTPLTIPPLTNTLKIPPIRQTWNKQPLLQPARRSPIGKFRQRFEVIPEEKSSSLSSAEEKNGRSLPKFADASTSPLPGEKIQFQSYRVKEVPNLFVAKITNKQLETLPYVGGNENQKIILFSSKQQNSNSTKGRDALIAMNREDFNRLAKGWMNFYKLSENMENSEEEKPKTPEKTEKDKQCLSESKPKQEVPELGENIRFDCSNTILRTGKTVPGCESGSGLGEKKSSPSGCFPKIGKPDADEDTDSDSTDYMEPPSPRVPPLPIDDIPSDETLSSSDTELNPPTTLKYLKFKKRGTTNRTKLKKDNETTRFGKKKNSGWSVTVAGTVELSRSAPDLEMRLSFPASGGRPLVSQSDSGFAELHDLDSSALADGNSKQKWTVTVKNPKKDEEKTHPNGSNLPELDTRNPKVLKNVELEQKLKNLVERKMLAIWPKVQNVIRSEFLTESGRLITEDKCDEDSCLSVRGSAVSLERKQKPPTMTERDLTRRWSSRSNN